MYSLFTPAFRQVFGVPLNYAALLKAESPKPMVGTAALECDGVDAMVIDTELPSSLPNPTGLEADVIHGVAVDDKGAATASIVSDPTFVAVCSACNKNFRKSKSHQGTRCWACKKSKARTVQQLSSSTEND